VPRPYAAHMTFGKGFERDMEGRFV
jgi:hypothetical protein